MLISDPTTPWLGVGRCLVDTNKVVCPREVIVLGMSPGNAG